MSNPALSYQTSLVEGGEAVMLVVVIAIVLVLVIRSLTYYGRR
jgi:hypothetical protein